ncbi:MAG: gamma-glutamylcyclotransferase family protein [Chloroflexota bacterium]
MNYFAYGSNLNLKQMKERCPEAKPRFTATLPNHRLVFVGWSRQWRGGVVTIRPMRGEKVKGAVYQISEQCLKQVDKYEGYPTTYDRKTVTVFDEDGTPVEAVAYIMSAQREETPPSKEYLAVIQQGYRDWHLV